ncbi:AraC family transcriptional regulator [Reticulibacter mediterranei]|uniref:AraC family transcriptional regulator n=1 Tax=Reticulibacter mediterranei TaxID=2778369 RepID=A0A8J3IT78_9CHLR|nr:AraC family transcriptional regulator [Reticulibacter mediterranei]GHO98105.1 AraC family transcriptional regulator [Reticulibacter mediterranei]
MKKVLAEREKATFWRTNVSGGQQLSDQQQQIALLRATYVTHTFVPHMHETFAVGMIEQGTETFHYRREQHVAPTSSVVAVNPGEVHTGSAFTEVGWSYRMYYPDPALFQRIASDLSGRTRDVPFFPQPVIPDKQIAQRLHLLHSVLETSNSLLERESLLLTTFADLIARHAEQPALSARVRVDHRAVQQVRDYLHAHLSDNVSLEQLAGLTQMSTYYLLRLFQQTTGLSPHAYLMQLRITRAKALLLAGVPIAQVALDMGFADQSHFTRYFKRLLGVTPGQYMPHHNIIQDNSLYLF